jgi:hypothetical protein
MHANALAHAVIVRETQSLMTRIDRIRAFALQETMVLAAALSVDAQTAIERHVEQGKRQLAEQVRAFLRWLESPAGRAAPADDAQRRFTFVRLRFNAVLAQFDIFSEAMSQRSEADTGVWLSGLDAVARDALALPGYFAAPPVICYLARGPGAAIRRARTRLPGGDENPVAVVRVPRERMIGAGLASSLIHEVGHQGAAMLNLVESLRLQFAALPGPHAGVDGTAWQLWGRWLSEIIADMWAVAKVGIASTNGLIGVVSLPRAFVFRTNADDPHPTPWIRVKLSAAIGHALYPHPQWERVRAVWDALYPLRGLDSERLALIQALERSLPRFVGFLVGHRPATLQGKPLHEVMGTRERQPEALAAMLQDWHTKPDAMRQVSPSLAFAVIGQARNDATISPEHEASVLADLLKHWALHSALNTSASCRVHNHLERVLPTAANANYPTHVVV